MEHMVVLYRHNCADSPVPSSPTKLAESFIATMKGEANSGYERSGHLELEVEYRWFLSSPVNGSLTWDEEDWPKLWGALREILETEGGEYWPVMRSLLWPIVVTRAPDPKSSTER